VSGTAKKKSEQQAPRVEVRQLSRIEDFERCVALERAVWGGDDLDLVPASMFVVTLKTGGQVLGAYDLANPAELIGFTMAVAAFRSKGGAVRPFLHSHMTAVLPEYQNRGVGRRLKLFQRAEALGRGIALVEWTFDPLELRNARFNLMRLGAVVRRFIPNLYGITSSPLHGGMPTDRLVAEWWLESDRVRAAVERGGEPPPPTVKSERIEVPAEIGTMRATNPAEALRIQSRVREEFQHWFSRGYTATGIEFGTAGASYLLEPDFPGEDGG
jgi:predicted GNAT superfamily acetyltransferase